MAAVVYVVAQWKLWQISANPPGFTTRSWPSNTPYLPIPVEMGDIIQKDVLLLDTFLYIYQCLIPITQHTLSNNQGGPKMEKGHDQHMCVFTRHNDLGKILERVKDAKFICQNCGRVANKAEYLCKPTAVNL